MILRHFILYLILNIISNGQILKLAKCLKLPKNDIKTTDTFSKVRVPYPSNTVRSPNCVQILCKFVCFNGKSTEIENDITTILGRNNYMCSKIEELRLYKYKFPDNLLTYGFLGNYSDRVEILYLVSSNITDIEAGSFANGSFKEIYFENLHVNELRKDLFLGISKDFYSLSVTQMEYPLQVVYSNFLAYVTYQINHLTMQAGLNSVCNLTGSVNLLHVDFSHNNFGHQVESTMFSKLSILKHLDLSHSNLEYLPSNIFYDFASTLQYLDLSYNKLKTISRTIFGWREVSKDLKIYASGNEWSCSCGFQMEMKNIFINQRTILVCAEPEWYTGWSVFDERICDASFPKENISIESIQQTTISNIEENIQNLFTSAEDEKFFTNDTLTTGYDYNFNSIIEGNAVKLSCPAFAENTSDRIRMDTQTRLIIFDVIRRKNYQVDVIIESHTDLNDYFGLIWFSNITSQYYKMEINYNKYGLGCYNKISYVTTVKHLKLDTAYTFCMVFKNSMGTSPFNCRSIYISGNMTIQNSAWLTEDHKITGLCLAIFGIIIFSFAGILMIYLLLKNKPVSLKGEKRVTNTHIRTHEAVIWSNDSSLPNILDKELKTFSSSSRRRNSTESMTSYQSCINSNLYEIIPAYNTISENKSLSNSSSHYLKNVHSNTESRDSDNYYLIPLQTRNLVKYSEVPYRAKHISKDTLTEVYVGHAPFR